VLWGDLPNWPQLLGAMEIGLFLLPLHETVENIHQLRVRGGACQAELLPSKLNSPQNSMKSKFIGSLLVSYEPQKFGHKPKEVNN
jgi:hypothetical protein